MNSGSVSHPDFHNGQLPFGSSGVNPLEKPYTPGGLKNTQTPQAYTLAGIKQLLTNFVIQPRI